MKLIDKKDFENFDVHLFKVTSNESPKPKLSICVTTYNQAHYIQNTLDSILSQITNFNFEIIIGDDASTDNNVAIIKTYIEKYPSKIKAYLHPFNLGPKKSIAKNNFLHSFFNCTGEYIVHIEGDDYFCDPTKLQKQVNFLDKNPEYSACFHNAKIVWEDWADRPDEFINSQNQKSTISIDDLLAEKETWFMATASVMMRREYVKALPSWFFDTVSGDIPLYIILASYGKIGYLPEVMSVYRKNLAGQSFVYKLHDANFVKNRIQLYKNLNQYTHYKYVTKIDPILADYYGLLAESRDFTNNIFARFFYTIFAIKYSKKYSILDLKDTFRNYTLQKSALNLSNLKKWFVNDLFRKTQKING